MTYRIEFSTKAEEDFLRLDGRLQNAIEAGLYRLAESPTRLSQPSVCPPYPAGCQMYEFQSDLDTELHVFVILFKYSVDEQALWILGIGHRRNTRYMESE